MESVHVERACDARPLFESRVVGRLIHRDRRRVGSITGEVMLDYGRGLCGLNAPRAQGAAGFLDRVGTIDFDDVTITSRDPYAAVLAVSLDDRPLASSRSVLVQVGTVARPTGWATRPATFEADGGKATVEALAVESSAAACTIRATSADFVRLVNGELSGADAFSAQRLRAEGDLGAAASLMSLGIM